MCVIIFPNVSLKVGFSKTWNPSKLDLWKPLKTKNWLQLVFKTRPSLVLSCVCRIHLLQDAPKKEVCCFSSSKVARRNKAREEVPRGKSLTEGYDAGVPDQAGEKHVLEEKHLQPVELDQHCSRRPPQRYSPSTSPKVSVLFPVCSYMRKRIGVLTTYSVQASFRR